MIILVHAELFQINLNASWTSSNEGISQFVCEIIEANNIKLNKIMWLRGRKYCYNNALDIIIKDASMLYCIAKILKISIPIRLPRERFQ